jgi:TPR repeat protein
MDVLLKANQLYSEGQYLQARTLYEQLAEEGNYGCSRRLGWMYFLGEGVERDLEKATDFFRKAADYDDLESIFCLGKVAFSLKKYDEAIEYYATANDKGFVPATYRLGWMHLNIKQCFDKSLGITYLQKATDEGHVRALRDLSVLQIKSPSVLLGLINYVRFITRLIKVAAKDTQDERLLF